MHWLLFALLLVSAALALWLAAVHSRERLGLPSGRIVYTDTDGWKPCMRVLFSRQYALTGKPDYLVQERRATVPVEVKPTRRAQQPHPGDVLQLAAYCLLIEEESGRRPPWGYLKYQDAVWRIDYTPSLREQLLARLLHMRRDLVAPDVPPSHDEPWRCLHCGQRAHCTRRLA
jgi:CRISPR-associated exonuclease Cas4